MQYLLMVLLFLTAAFLIVLVLVQRGKGGGLAGALGGMGGQSAFGTKAGDLFTRITIGVAAFWILLCMFSVKYLGAGSDFLGTGSKPAATAPKDAASKDKGTAKPDQGNAAADGTKAEAESKTPDK